MGNQILEDSTGSAARTSLDDWIENRSIETQPEAANPLDSEENQRLLHKIQEWLQIERQKQAANRYQMALDHDFYDGLQWSEEDIQTLNERNQAPLVYNLIKPTVDWITGTEKRTRVDFKVLPREEEDEEAAQVKTKILKYLSDVNRTVFARSRAFADAVKGGVGYLEDGVRSDPDDEPIFSRYENWRYVIEDSLGVEMDGSDHRYRFRWKWVDLDVALVMFPNRSNKVRQAALNTDKYGREPDDDFWYLGQHSRQYDDRGEIVGRRIFTSDTQVAFNRRSRVRLYECWYRKPVLVKMVRGQAFDGEHYDPNHPQMRAAVENGLASVYDSIQMQMRLAIFVDGALLQEGVSPYKHNRFPINGVYCFRRGRDGAFYGVIRNIRDPQEDLNKRMSKSQHILASNQVIMEEGAVNDLDELAEEVARPDGIIVKNKGKELEIKRDNQLAEQHIALAHFDAQKIQDAGGITDEQMGRSTNAQSGTAIQARQLQGSVVTAEPFDNLRMAIQIQGEIQLSLVEQFMPMPKQIRLVGNKGALEWVKINQPKQGEDGSVTFENDITESECDFVVDQQDFHATMRQSMFSEMLDMVSKMPPEVGLRLLDLVIEFSDVPNKDEIVARIRKITGEADPNAKLTPEEAQQIQQAQAQAQQQAAMQQKAVELDLAIKEATVNKLNAEAQSLAARAQGEGADNSGVMAQIQNIQEQCAAEIAKARDEVMQTKAATDKQIQDMAAKYNSTVRAAEIAARAKSDDAQATAELQNAAATIRAKAEKEATIEAARITADSNERIAKIENDSAAAVKAAEDRMGKLIEGLQKELADIKTKAAEKPAAEPKQLAATAPAAPAPAPNVNITLQAGAIQVDAKSPAVSKTITIQSPSGDPMTATITPEKKDDAK